jgi:hypothetical protein
MKDRTLLWFILLVFSLALALMLIFRDFVRENIVTPILYLFWLGNQIYTHLDQLFLWILLLVFFAMIVFRSMRYIRISTNRLVEIEAGTKGSGRVYFWVKQIRLRAAPRISDEFALVEFRRLILSVLAEVKRMDPVEVEHRILSGEIQVPPDIQAALKLEIPEAPSPKIPWFARIRDRLRVKRSGKWVFLSPALASELEETVQYLEDQLEINHEHENR